MGKSEVGNELHSLNQVTIALLLLAMVLMRDTMDSEVILAICLACILSLVITEVELSQDPVSDINRNSAEGDPGQEQFTTATGTPIATVEGFPVDDDPGHHAYAESGTHEQDEPDPNQPSIPPHRRPITAYSSVPDETGTAHNREVRWKPMPPKSVVPTKNPATKETHTLSIRFVD
ncbi:MAG: hypothetical protein GX052_04080 [Syntrophomonadaceae bacterium]|nr:hypothetical protein [Syntrophomonadaceae bacterium]